MLAAWGGTEGGVEHKQANKENMVDKKCTGRPNKMFCIDLNVDGQQGWLLTQADSCDLCKP